MTRKEAIIEAVVVLLWLFLLYILPGLLMYPCHPGPCSRDACGVVTCPLVCPPR